MATSTSDKLKKDLKQFIKDHEALLKEYREMHQMNPPISDARGSPTFRETMAPYRFGRTPGSLLVLKRYPSGVDAELAELVLEQAGLIAAAHPWMMSWTLAVLEKKQTEEKHEEIARWRSTWRRGVAWNMKILGSLQRGSIVEDDPHRNPSTRLNLQYNRDMRTNFGNSPCRAANQKMELSGTHVAVGFNDLQVLTAASSHLSGDIRFVGYDWSTYSVAKSAAMAKLLEIATPEQVVEAWYSSTWTESTLAAFKRACKMALHTYPGEPEEHADREVKAYLSHWLAAEPISAKRARRRWMKLSADPTRIWVYSSTTNFHQAIDREHLLLYFMSGEFIAKKHRKEAKVGSLTTWSNPDWALRDNHGDQDRVVNTVVLQDILDEMTSSSTKSSLSVLDYLMKVKVRDVARLQQHMKTNAVYIDVRYGDVQVLQSLAGKALGDEIRSLRPDSMSWSNMLDYMVLSELHELAWYCSHPQKDKPTIHYGYSMHWPSAVFGTDINDYETEAERKFLLNQAMGDKAEELGEQSGASTLLTIPYFEHPRKLVGAQLAHVMKPDWLKHFRKSASRQVIFHGHIDKNKKSCGELEVLHQEICSHWPVSRSDQTIFLTWQYKNQVSSNETKD
jgi:hypothetical protein